MTVSVEPREFKFVTFDHATIVRVAEDLVAALGMGDLDIAITVDETTPLARMTAEIGADGTVAIGAESGSLEDTRTPRHLSETATATSLGRVLLRVRDRRDGFAAAPADADLTLAQLAAWETYCVGRLARLGTPVNEQRWRYNFRNRHGFTDAGDAAFDRLWTSEGLTWEQLEAISAGAATAVTS